MSNKFDWKPVLEALKEPAREAVMAVIPYLLVYLQVLNVWWATALYGFLRALDKFLHESKSLERGLTRF